MYRVSSHFNSLKYWQFCMVKGNYLAVQFLSKRLRESRFLAPSWLSRNLLDKYALHRRHKKCALFICCHSRFTQLYKTVSTSNIQICVVKSNPNRQFWAGQNLTDSWYDAADFDWYLIHCCINWRWDRLSETWFRLDLLYNYIVNVVSDNL